MNMSISFKFSESVCLKTNIFKLSKESIYGIKNRYPDCNHIVGTTNKFS